MTTGPEMIHAGHAHPVGATVVDGGVKAVSGSWVAMATEKIGASVDNEPSISPVIAG